MSQNKDLKPKKILLDSVLVVECNPHQNQLITNSEDSITKFVVSECFYDACEAKNRDIKDINIFQSVLEEEYCLKFLDIEKLNKNEAKKLVNEIAQSSKEIEDHNVIKEVAFAKALGIDNIITENPEKYPTTDGLNICYPSQCFVVNKDDWMDYTLKQRIQYIKTEEIKTEKTSITNKRPIIDQAQIPIELKSKIGRYLLINIKQLSWWKIGAVLGFFIGLFFLTNDLYKRPLKLDFSCSEPDLMSPESYPKLIPSDLQKFPKIHLLYQDDSLTSLKQAMNKCEQINKRLDKVFSKNDVASIGFEWNQEGQLIVCGREKGDNYCHTDKVILSIPLTGNLREKIGEVQNKFQCFNNDSCEFIEPIKLYFTDDIEF